VRLLSVTHRFVGIAGCAAYLSSVLGLPDDVRACLFDLDGVLTDTASLHAAAWTETFNEFLPPQQPRFSQQDYNATVDGRPRLDGVRTFLASRGIDLPEGTDDDPPTASTIHGLATRKNELVLRRIAAGGARVYPGSVAYLHAARDAGLRRAVVSASRNSHDVLVATGLIDLIEVEVDGNVAAREHLRGKPHPDTFLAAATKLGLPPAQTAIFEDAVAGVEAGRAAAAGFVVGVDRVGHADDLRAGGASIVVADLSELVEQS
jgi:beta-phosphoglucomutase family hydrolase